MKATSVYLNYLFQTSLEHPIVTVLGLTFIIWLLLAVIAQLLTDSAGNPIFKKRKKN